MTVELAHSATEMEASPLARQTRPDFFEPKIVALYQSLFDLNNDAVRAEGFWREFFLLSPAKEHLRRILDPLTADEILHLQDRTRLFFAQATQEVHHGREPRNQHALENLTAFLGAVLTKKYTNPSSDIITVLAGLDQVDERVSDLVGSIDGISRNASNLEVRTKAVGTALAFTANAYSTGLMSYFTHCDLFPGLMKYANDLDDPSLSVQPMLLLGLLANHNKFEFQNPYQHRLEDFVNEQVMQSIVQRIECICSRIRDSFLAVQDDAPEGWHISTALAYVGLQSLAPESKRRKAALPEEEAKRRFDQLPPVEASIYLPIYAFVRANKLFASKFISPREPHSAPSAFAAFLSSVSYLSHHAYRSSRCSRYCVLALLTIQALVEDSVLSKRLASEEVPIRLSQQRPPYPPLVSSKRIPAAAILDICSDSINHNLRRRLDLPLYNLALGIMLRVVSYLGQHRIRLTSHWPYLWASLISLLRFLTQYASDMISSLPSIQVEVCTPLANFLAFCLSSGEQFLPDSSSHDDLFYKIIELGADLLIKFRNAYYPSASHNTTSAPTTTTPTPPSINILLHVSNHYHDLLSSASSRNQTSGVASSEKDPTKSTTTHHRSPATIHKVIRQGYDTLNIEAGTELGSWEPWREHGGRWKGELKAIVRMLVMDAREIVR